MSLKGFNLASLFAIPADIWTKGPIFPIYKGAQNPAKMPIHFPIIV